MTISQEEKPRHSDAFLNLPFRATDDQVGDHHYEYVQVDPDVDRQFPALWNFRFPQLFVEQIETVSGYDSTIEVRRGRGASPQG